MQQRIHRAAAPPRQPVRPVRPPIPPQHPRSPQPQRPNLKTNRMLVYALIGGGLMVGMGVVAIIAIGFGVLVLLSSERVLPGVSAAGVSLGGYTLDEATAQLESNWQNITVRDGDRTWLIPPVQLGLVLDTNATAQAAQQRGRSEGSFLGALFGGEDVAPTESVNAAAAQQGIKGLMPTVEMPAQNATIRLVNGDLTPVPPVEGRLLDLNATVSRLVSSAGEELADGALDLVMIPASPTVTDASALLEKTRALLASPLTLNAWNAITNQSIPWTIPAEQWNQWLTTTNTPTGIALSLEKGPLSNYLGGQNNSLGADRSIDIEKSISALQKAIGAGQTSATTRVYNKPTKYQVSGGETLMSIAWKNGIQMWRISRANPGVNMDALSAGQIITLPSKDELLEKPLVENKRIVVSISKQRMWVYENGQIKWEWLASTGIPDSPTQPGVYQILSHEPNAYAGNWNLNMPYFMGIYDAVPGFTNGIHGFPTRNGYGILWENALGRRVTYGCILLSTTNAKLLYDWAQEGVVIEIQA
jgi:lipoprotein-anchoring transpeptidase ErfK/SrfK